MRKNITLLTIAWCLLLLFSGTSFGAMDVPAAKQTELGLYVTAQEAYVMWHQNPESYALLDVRTPGEYIFVGHAPNAVNIPLSFLGTGCDVNRKKPVMTRNENFTAEVAQRFSKDETILVMCRSGGRSAAAVNLLAKTGFSKVYNIVDGFEGDALKMETSYHHGKRIVNGWKNAGVPWTYDLDPALMYTPLP